MQDKVKYIGEFKNGKAESGSLEFENGDRYQGEVLNFQMHGLGKFVDKQTGHVFIG